MPAAATLAHPIFAAIDRDDLAQVERLFVSTQGNAIVDRYGASPLHAASSHPRIFRRLYELGADVRSEDMAGRTPLLTASGEGCLEVIDFLLSKTGANGLDLLEKITKIGNTALHRAAAYGHANVVQRLLHLGSANAPRLNLDVTNDGQETALLRAARWGHVDIVRLLLDAGADPTIVDAHNRSPLDWAAEKGHDDVLISLNAAISKRVSAPVAPSHPTSGMSRAARVQAASAASADRDSAKMSVNDIIASTQPPITPSYDTASVDGTADARGLMAYGMQDGLPGPVRAEGWVAKCGNVIRTWKNRFFVLEGRKITYFAREPPAHAPHTVKPKGIILLSEGTDVIVEERYPKPFCFTLLTPSRRYVLQAANGDEMEAWVESILCNLLFVPPHEMFSSATSFAFDDDDA